MTLVSYSQNQEDIILWRALCHVTEGFYIDVGANDPIDDSVTKLFYDRGWNGINIEPDPVYFAKLTEERPRDHNLSCAAGELDGTTVFYDVDTRGWSTSDAIVGQQYVTREIAKEREVKKLTLDTIIATQEPGEIHFLKIDVEGAEAEVLKGLSLNNNRPWVIVIESLDPITKESRAKEWESRLLAHNYTLVYFDGLNNYYLAQEHGDLAGAFSAPPNVLDNFTLNSTAELEKRAGQAEQRAVQAESQFAQAAERAALDKVQLEALLSSRSWRVTAPLRRMAVQLRTLKAIQPRETIKGLAKVLLKRSARFVERRPKLRALILGLLDRTPVLKHRLHMMVLRAENTSARVSSRKASTRPSIVTFAKAPPSMLRKRQRILNPSLGTLYYYVDHTILCPSNTGMQRVSRLLARALLESGERLVFVKWHTELDRLVLVTQSELEHLSLWGGPELSAEEINIAGYPSADDSAIVIEGDDIHDRNWLVVPEVSHINYHHRQLTLDIILAAKRASLRTAFVFYDAIPLRRSELAGMAAFHEAYMRQLLQADLVVPISDWSAKDLSCFLAEHEGVDAAYLPRISPTLLPAEVCDEDRVTDEDAVKKVIESRRILCVGSVDKRKNQMALVREFVSLVNTGQAKGWRLELIGNLNQALRDELHSLMKACPSVVWLGNCADSELKQAYADCAFTVFPSVEEGFGLPVAESLWYGKPCLCADFGPMAEIATEGGCLAVDMRDPEALREGLQSLINDAALRQALAREAQHRKLMTWADYAGNFRRLLHDSSYPVSDFGATYYLVDHTISYPKNTGIQRVVRSLAAALLRQGVCLIPAKWNQDKTALLPPTELELQHLAEWNGPPVVGWAGWREPRARNKDWVVFPELTSHYLPEEYVRIREFLDSHAMRGCWVFYDTIPWKLRDIYPSEAAEGHRNYMAGLNLFDLILPISHYSRDQLELFYLGEPQATVGLPQRLIACPLPGEFLESERIVELKPQSDQIEILSVGTLEPRKNHLTLIRAFLRAASGSERPMRLTLAGGGPSEEIAAQVERLAKQYSDKLRWVQSPDDEDLNKLYAASDFTVYPSYEEGFGLPILESLWHARPCICMNQGAMAEVALGGGCLQVNVCIEDELVQAIKKMVQDDSLRQRLGTEATQRQFRTWDDYANDFVLLMAQERWLPRREGDSSSLSVSPDASYQSMCNITRRPLLSVCISTFNRAKWLSLSLEVLVREAKELGAKVELLVCDNTSTDETPDVVKPYVQRGVVRYHRNPKNVGMLGNLRVTAQEASGRYIWILGDDDVISPGAVKKVVDVLENNHELALVYLNYAYTRDDTPKEISKLEKFYASATPVVPGGSDQSGLVKDVAVLNENFFTAIYCVVFQRSHALLAYSQFTEGEPFSSLQTCVPTTQHVLNHMMDLPAYWVGSPQLVVNLNVSWMRYAWRWILERFPEMHDLAIKHGADTSGVDYWRDNYMPHTEHYLNVVFSEMDGEIVSSNFDFATLISRIKHTSGYKKHQPAFSEIYAKAYEQGHPLAQRHPDTIFVNN